MRPFLLFCLLACCSLTASAQLGVSGRVAFHELRWRGGAEPSSALDLQPTYEIGLNYWFRLPKRRIEFLPSIYYGEADGEMAGTVNGLPIPRMPFAKFYGAEFRTLFYLFDLAEDCDCPTFGKQGPQLQKGFFVELAPGYLLVDRTDPTSASGLFGPGEQHNFTLNLGAGLDVGLSNFLTVTPHVNYRFSGSVADEIEFTDVNGMPTGRGEASLRTFTAGLRVALRFDAGRY